MAARTAIHLCSGYGGFELALRSVARVRTVAHVERDAYAAAVLVERMGEARLDQAPVWDDLTTFDGKPWRGRVDLITAGFPCQPFSLAGQQRGIDDDRWLWPAIASIVADVEPEFVLLENVPQLVRLGLPHVLHDLADLGFDAEWGLLSAAAVGAPHRRERIWIVAHAERSGRLPQVGDDGARQPDVARCGPAVADATRLDEREPHRQACALSWAGPRRDVGWNSEGLADTEDDRCEQGDAWRHAQKLPWPPHRDDHDGWSRWIAKGRPQPVLRRDLDGPPDGLADALHLGGNGLVPQAAAHAIRQLLDRGGWLM